MAKCDVCGNDSDNRYTLALLALHKGVFSGTGVIDPFAKEPGRRMGELAEKGARWPRTRR